MTGGVSYFVYMNGKTLAPPRRRDIGPRYPPARLRMSALREGSWLRPSAARRRAYNLGLAALHGLLLLGAIFVPDAIVPLQTPVAEWRDESEREAGEGSGAGADPWACGDRPLCTRLLDDALFVGTLNIAGLTAAFFAVTAAAHSFYALQWERYDRLVSGGRMWWRWVEYALSVPPMLLIISMANGLTLDLALLQTAILGSATQFFGFTAEQRAAAARDVRGTDRSDRSERVGGLGYRERELVSSARWCHGLGYAPMTAAFLPVIASASQLPGTDAPWFVPFIIVTQAAFFLSFGFVQLHAVAMLRSDIESGHARARYEACDTVYLLLSAACKATLGGGVLGLAAFVQPEAAS